MSDRAMSETALLALTISTLSAWAQEEVEANPESGVSYEQRLAENFETFYASLAESFAYALR